MQVYSATGISVEKIQLQKQVKSMVVNPEIFDLHKTGHFHVALTTMNEVIGFAQHQDYSVESFDQRAANAVGLR